MHRILNQLDQVVFRRRDGAAPWRYETGEVFWVAADNCGVYYQENCRSYAVAVPAADIIAVHDDTRPPVTIGPFPGRYRLLQAVDPEPERA